MAAVSYLGVKGAMSITQKEALITFNNLLSMPDKRFPPIEFKNDPTGLKAYKYAIAYFLIMKDYPAYITDENIATLRDAIFNRYLLSWIDNFGKDTTGSIVGMFKDLLLDRETYKGNEKNEGEIKPADNIPSTASIGTQVDF
jgi:hypothetical protein